MSQLNPISALAELYLFPYYLSQEDYKKATGMDAPAYVPYKPRKYWLDPQAKESTKRYIIYDRSLVTKDDGFTPAVGEDHQPVVDQLILPKEDAAVVNIPPTRFYEPGQEPPPSPEVQPPLRALLTNEVIYFHLGGSVMVKRPDLLEQMNDGFNSADRRILEAIAAKLGV